MGRGGLEVRKSQSQVSTLLPSMDELQVKDAILILDRGFISEKVLAGIFQWDRSVVVPQRRNSTYFETRVHRTEQFMYHKRLIRGGRREIGGRILYLFEDKDLKLEKIKTLLRRVKKEEITPNEAKMREKPAGRILFVSNVDTCPQEIYELYKTRDLVEKNFDTLKNEMRADVLYLDDRSAVCGHLFVGFLCLYLYCKLQAGIKKAELTAEYSPKDPLLIFSKVMRISYDGFDQITEVPKKVRDLEKKLKLRLFPT